MTDEPLKLSLVRQTKPVFLTDEMGTEKEYVLKEMTGSQRDRWMKDVAKRVDPKNQKVTNFEGAVAGLICMCLFDKEKDLPADPTVVQAWPASVQETLFKLCQKMNGMDKDEVEDQKND